jgi:site-specific DNA recombinase
MADKKVLHIYCRVSSEIQVQGHSLAAQELEGKRKAEQLGYDFEVHTDAGKSAKDDDTTNRPALAELLKQIDGGKVKDIFVTETDRLTRSPELHFKMKVKFIRHNVIIHTATGSIDYNDYDQEFMSDIKALINKRENSVKSARSVRGMIEGAKKGRWGGAMLPYGYRRDENRFLAVDEIEAEVYRQMVAWCLEGEGTNSIANKLNALGIPTRAKKVLHNGTKVVNKYTKTVRHVTNEEFVWRPGSVYCILTNGIHKGERKYRGEIISAPHIIDDRTWDKVQQQLKKNRSCAFNHGVHDYLLKGLLRCGVCGANLYGRIKSNERTYMCSSKRYKSCGIRSVNLDRIEHLVWDRIINSGQYLSQIQYEWNETGNVAALKLSDKEIVGIRKEVASLEGREDKLLELYELGGIDAERFNKRKKEIQIAKTALTDKLYNEEQRNLALAQLKNNSDALFAGLKGLWNVHEELNKLNFTEKRQLLHQLGTNIIITWNLTKRCHEIEITFSVNGFRYEKKAVLASKIEMDIKPTPHAYWTGQEVNFFSKLFQNEVAYSKQLHITEPALR